MNDSAFVKPGDLPIMLRTALKETDHSVADDSLDIEELRFPGAEQVIAAGTARYRPVENHEPPQYGDVDRFNFEVVAGTHKEKKLVLDPVEVVIEDIAEGEA